MHAVLNPAEARPKAALWGEGKSSGQRGQSANWEREAEKGDHAPTEHAIALRMHTEVQRLQRHDNAIILVFDDRIVALGRMTVCPLIAGARAARPLAGERSTCFLVAGECERRSTC